MDAQRKIFNLIILDESGSMNSIKEATISGFNETVQTINGAQREHPGETHYITLVSFNGMGIKTLLHNQPAVALSEIDATRYRPDANTPLYDAMGMAFHRLSTQLELLDNYHVLVTIFTDGLENASKEYNGASIRKLVEGLKTRNWTFTYIGANHNVEQFAHNIAIHNTVMYNASPEDVDRVLARERSSRMNFYKKLRENKPVDDDFFAPSGGEG